MPGTSKKQHDFMNAIAHSKDFANKVDVPQEVGKDFVKADEMESLWQKEHKRTKQLRKKRLHKL